MDHKKFALLQITRALGASQVVKGMDEKQTSSQLFSFVSLVFYFWGERRRCLLHKFPSKFRGFLVYFLPCFLFCKWLKKVAQGDPLLQSFKRIIEPKICQIFASLPQQCNDESFLFAGVCISPFPFDDCAASTDIWIPQFCHYLHWKEVRNSQFHLGNYRFHVRNWQCHHCYFRLLFGISSTYSCLDWNG